jgi:polygalacturonase
LIIVNANYGSCSGTAGNPQFQEIIVNGVKAENSVSGAYETFNGYSSSYIGQIYLGNIDLDNNTQSGDQYFNTYLDNVNGLDPSGTDVTNGTWSASGSVPSCSFAF